MSNIFDFFATLIKLKPKIFSETNVFSENILDLHKMQLVLAVSVILMCFSPCFTDF